MTNLRITPWKGTSREKEDSTHTSMGVTSQTCKAELKGATEGVAWAPIAEKRRPCSTCAGAFQEQTSWGIGRSGYTQGLLFERMRSGSRIYGRRRGIGGARG